MADKHVRRVVNLMVLARSQPFSVPPAVMAELCRKLHKLNPEYNTIQPGLFSSYIPNVGPRMTEEDLQVLSSSTVDSDLELDNCVLGPDGAR